MLNYSTEGACDLGNSANTVTIIRKRDESGPTSTPNPRTNKQIRFKKTLATLCLSLGKWLIDKLCMYDVVTSMYVKLAEIISLTKLSTLHRFCNLLMEVVCMNIYYLVDIPETFQIWYMMRDLTINIAQLLLLSKFEFPVQKTLNLMLNVSANKLLTFLILLFKSNPEQMEFFHAIFFWPI